MQVFGNIGSEPEVKVSRATSKKYVEFRLCESHRALPGESCWFTVRVMHDRPLNLAKGDFVKVTGRLKTDFYMSRDGKPTGTLLVIAFEAAKIAKPAAAMAAAAVADDGAAPKARAAEVSEAKAPAPTAMPTQTSTTPVVAQASIFDWQD